MQARQLPMLPYSAPAACLIPLPIHQLAGYVSPMADQCATVPPTLVQAGGRIARRFPLCHPMKVSTPADPSSCSTPATSTLIQELTGSPPCPQHVGCLLYLHCVLQLASCVSPMAEQYTNCSTFLQFPLDMEARRLPILSCSTPTTSYSSTMLSGCETPISS